MPISGGQALFRRPCCSRLSSVRRRFRSFQVFSPTDSCLRVLRDAFVARAPRKRSGKLSPSSPSFAKMSSIFASDLFHLLAGLATLRRILRDIDVIGFFYRPKRLSRRRFAWFTVCFAIEAPTLDYCLKINARTTVGNDFEK